ncbi:gamma-glutamyltransferase [Hirschia maritima]|uniref:gamma-glutamyltransferase n=1 Tax=Hirschia maritima TaxID=1121961 RepID=UPI00037DEAFA|nr:gamma-glutamyltransferase [Hirschia maritima]
MIFKHVLLSATALISLSACQTEDAVKTPTPPSNATKDVSQPEWRLAGKAMATAANPHAVKAAEKVLAEGGHAVDAAIAAHAVLGLVEPQSSGIGGGGFMMVYDRASDTIRMYDGRETAPSSIDESLFLDENGKTRGYVESWQNGISVGVPSIVRTYEQAHEDFGMASWEKLFGDAETLARDGFNVSPRLNKLLSNPRLRGAINLDDNPKSAAYFYPDGEPLVVGTLLTNPAYADMMQNIAINGADWFYGEGMAGAIETAVQSTTIPGELTAEDIAAYQTIERDALCGAYKTYKICSAPPPSSGGITQPMILGLYERFTDGLDFTTAENSNSFPSDKHLKAFVDAQRLAYADRDHYVADSDFVSVPMHDLINSKYLDARAKERFEPSQKSKAGDPGKVLRNEPIIDMWGRDTTDETPGTTHLSIVDVYGNAVSMTATVESPFGSSIWVPEGGFLLNNELTDFARNPRIEGKLVANAPSPNKRPRSSMSPTLVFDENDDLFMVTGSPGGNSIIAYTAKSLLGVLDWQMDAQTAADLPNIIARGDTVNVEIGVANGQHASDTLKAAGYSVKEREGENSGIHTIVARTDHYEGAADMRREGIVVSIDKEAD